MNSLPQVNVVMPTFEQSHFIRRALDSLMAQTLANWELIVIDDGSQDATAAALLVACVPSDDLYYSDHLRQLCARHALLPSADGLVHTVVPGRPFGLHPHTAAELAAQGIRVHFYGDFTHGQWREWIAKALARPLDIGVFYDKVDELGPMLRQREHMQALRSRVWDARPLFTFDHHVAALADFFRTVMANRSPVRSRSAA